MPVPSLAQLDAGFNVARALADTSSVYGHMITDDEIRKFVAVIAQAVINAPGTPPPTTGEAA
jgi:hypothetical protein